MLCRRFISLFVPAIIALASFPASSRPAAAQHGPINLTSGRVVVATDSFLRAPVYGLDQTRSTESVESVAGEPFDSARFVAIGTTSAETNATQIVTLNTAEVDKGDTMLAEFWIRGRSADGGSPAQISFLFERASDPWTNSVTFGAKTPADPTRWKHVMIPFTAAESYSPGQVQAAVRVAFGPQHVEVAGLAVRDFGGAAAVSDLVDEVARRSPIGPANVTVDRSVRKQVMIGFGGDFCQPRYGQTDAIDRVGAYNLAHLSVAQARVGIPLNYWTPERGVYNDDSQAHAAFLLMRMLHAKGIPIIGTVWEGPTWMLPGRPEQSGRVLAPSEYGDCIEAIAKFLVTARDKYGVDVSYFSFNEANYGVNFLFAPAQIDAFIRQAGPRFAQLGLKTKFLVGDTTGGAPFADYAKPILADPAAAPYLGALAFHCWDALGASDRRYEDIADIGRATGKPIYCTEAGWDAGLWSKPDPWESWENGLRTAEAYARTMRLSGACTLDYWTYEDNYPIVSSDGAEPFPVFTVIERIQDAFPPGSRIVASRADSGDIETAASVGPKRGEFSLLIVDTSGSADLTVSGLPAGLTVRCDRLTGTGETIDPAMRVDPRGEIVLRIDPRSVVVARGSIK